MRLSHFSLSVPLLASLSLACSGPASSGFASDPYADGSTFMGPGAQEDSGIKLGTAPGPGSGSTDAATTTTDGPVDTTPPCDVGLAVDGDAVLFAKAIGICTQASTVGYGLVTAAYSNAFGSTVAPHYGQWGILPKFGSVIVPREGSSLGVLSSGYAREYDDEAGVFLGTIGTEPWQGPSPISDFVNSSPDGALDGMSYPTGQAPPGFPKAAMGCEQDDKVNDMIDVKLTLKAPPDATGFRFDFDFYSSEWPNFVCSNFNDAFIAYLTSKNLTDNVSFDSDGNPIAVNNGFLNRCTPNTPVGCLSNSYEDGMSGPPIATAACAAGPSELGGTGFGDTYETQCNGGNVNATLGGATGWLTTQAPITPGEEFTLEFMIWDAGDGYLDSSVLIDHFQWIGGMTVMTGTSRPPAPK
jgi:hypothetical protein